MKYPSRWMYGLCALTLLISLMPLSAAAASEGTDLSGTLRSEAEEAAADAAPSLPEPVSPGSPVSPTPPELISPAGPAAITGFAVQVAPKTYDGRTDNVSAQVTFQGVDTQPAPEDYVLRADYLDPAVTRDPVPNVTVSLSLTEAGQQKYTLVQDLTQPRSLFGEISPAVITVRARDQLLPAGGSPDLSPAMAEVSVTTGETPVLSAVTLTARGNGIRPSDARVTVSGPAGDTTGNYVLSYEEGALSYQAAAVTAAPQALEGLTYDGCSHALIAPGTAAGGTMVYYAVKDASPLAVRPDWQPEIPQAREAGTYTVHYQAQARTEGHENSPEGTLSVTIAPRPVTITARVEKLYDGNASVPQADGYDRLLDVRIPEDAFLESDNVQFLGTTGSRFKEEAGNLDAGSDRTVLPGTAAFSGDAQNYHVVLELRGSIIPRPATVYLGGSKHYGQKDPVLYTVSGLINGDSLSGTVIRQPGEHQGSYPCYAEGFSNPNYDITLREGSLKILPAEARLELALSRSSVRAGSTVTLTLTAENLGQDLMDSGWDAPAALTLTAEGRDLKLTEKKGKWTASYKLPRDAGGTVTFTASLADPEGNYSPASAEASLTVRKAGSVPDTGDSRNPAAYIATAAVSGFTLTGVLVWLYLRMKKTR